ncbi:response regulator [Neorhizobium sp. NCHU2750]|uniref:PAS domain-containing hybrid sensor histidine kinase/response regulator n=1 Tax=Neorhizobium sp. NCHU2750 TaxID=1825976 RepID=UPI000E73D2BC|nr:histidine kinase [Neorhizobium sp. NCHU2750]
MDTHSDLLEKACARIQDLAQPAYIKDSALRYVAVNAAYAELFHANPQDFAHHASSDLADTVDVGERKEKESRAIVFGSDEVARLSDATGVLRYEIHVERFLTENDHTYLFGSIDVVPAAQSLQAAGPSQLAQISPLGAAVFNNVLFDDALDMLEMGIAICDRNDTLIYCNSQLLDYVDSLDIEVKPGITLQAILANAFDRGKPLPGHERYASELDRAVWIEERMKPFRQPYYESMDQLADGRWLRTVNKRMENGILIAIRQDVTDFKEQEMLLRSQVAETELFRAILEDLPTPVFVRNAGHELTYANHAYEQMLGDSRDRYIGQTEAEMFPWAAERFWDENARVLDGENIDKSEDMTFPDGSVIPVLTRLRSIRTEDGSSYLVCSRTDVSLIRQAQEKAEKVSRELQTILDALPVGVAILSEGFDFEYANPAFCAFWDTDKSFDLAGSSYRSFLQFAFDRGVFAKIGGDFESVYRQRIASLTEDGHAPLEVRSLTGHQVLISGSLLADGKHLLSYTDITAMRKRDAEIQEARAALERHGALMRDATGAMSQGLLILKDGQVELSNDALSAMLEIAPAMVAPGAQWRDLFRYCVRRGDLGASDEAHGTFRSLEDNMASGEPFFASFKIDNRKWVQVEARQTSSEHWLAVFTDVTDVKAREEDLTRLLARAEAADRAKSEFLANMSHEIRTPMNGVLGMAELLAKSALDTRQKTFIDIIVKSGNALLTIINDILDFSKIDAGQMKLRKAPFDPVEAIEDVATLLSSAASEKDIELIVRGDAAVRETVLGDAGRFRQIITNLVGNAVKFTEKGHVFIDLKSEPHGEGNLMLTVRIEDTGLGIPPEKLASVFEKFSQVDTSSTRRHEGTGLGLAITSGLVELFGGSVAVASELGRGSIFTVSLPFPVVAERKTATALPINTSGARVLIVDDNIVNRRILTEQLSMWGFDTVAAESGAEGLAVLSEAARLGITVDAIVLDYHMPEMNGLDFARSLRGDKRFDNTGIIFLTSMDMASDDSMFAELRIHAHLMKPARANLLRSTVIEVVRSVRSRLRMEATVAGEAISQAAGLPAVTSAQSTPASTAPVEASASLDVLVAEDNEVNQIVFTQILQTTGWLFQIVRNGAEAVEAWQANDPAIILMDVSMPVMNGHQATQRIRELEAQTGTHTPIIGVTAHALESDRELCFQAGMDDYLSKPISPEALEEKIRTWIGGARLSTRSR